MACVLSPLLSVDACSPFEPVSKSLPAITIKQPFASLVGWGVKTIEVRPSNLNYRGPLVICSGKKVFDGNSLLIPNSLEYYRQYAEIMPQGMAIAVVELIDCRPMRKEDADRAFVPYSEGLFSWILRDATSIEPFEVSGKLGIFQVKQNRIVFRHF